MRQQWVPFLSTNHVGGLGGGAEVVVVVVAGFAVKRSQPEIASA